jgi:hypothetical protein
MSKYMRFEGLWLFGHTHSSIDFYEKSLRVVSNPHGYGLENPEYDHQKLIEI